MSVRPAETQTALSRPALMLAVGIAIFLSGCLTYLVPKPPDQFVPIGLVNPVFVASILLVRRSEWGWVTASALAAEFAIGLLVGPPPGLMAAAIASSVGECLLCATLLRRVLRETPDTRQVSVIARCLAISLMAAALGAFFAALAQVAFSGAPFWRNFVVWLARDFTGFATLTPCLVILLVRPARLRELFSLRGWPIVLLLVVEWVVFFGNALPLTYLVLAALMIVTWRLKSTGVAVSVLLTLVMAVAGTLSGRGPFSVGPGEITERLLMLQLFLTISFQLTVPVAAQLARSRRLRDALGDALKAARDSEARYRLIADNTGDIIVQLDQTGRIVYASPSCRLLGYAAEEMLGRTGADFLHPDDVERLVANTRLLLMGVNDPDSDRRYRLRLKSGAYRWYESCPSPVLDQDGEVTCVVSTLRDIHHHQLASEALAASEARYRVLADNMNDMAACYGSDGKITFASGAAEAITGYAPDELVGMTMADLVHPADFDRGREACRRHREMGPGAPAFRVECRFRRKDGSVVWVEGNPRAIYEDGRFVEWQDIIRDSRRRKALEDKLRSARASADAAARLRADFLADIGHEVRGPMNSVLAFARQARAQAGGGRVGRYIDGIEAAVEGLLVMVSDVLDFSRLEASQMPFRREPLRIDDFLRGAIGQLQPQARGKKVNIVLINRAPPGLVVSTDANRLRQVLLNLLSNAVKFTHAGEVAVTAEHDAGAGRLRLEVRDTGPGIDPGQLPHLFERFSRASSAVGRAHGGIGLGLAISKGIVEGLGGEIEVQSVLGEGARFSFWIPAAAVSLEARAGAGDAAAPEPLLVLLATGDADLRERLAKALGARANVLAVGGMDDAVRRAADARADLLVLDLALGCVADLGRLRDKSGPNAATPALAVCDDGVGDGGAAFDGALARDASSAQLLSAIAGALDPNGRPRARRRRAPA